MSRDADMGLEVKLCVLFRGLCRRSASPYGSVRPPDMLSRRRLPAVMGEGYVHSRPEFSQDRHVVPTPLFTHLTLLRLHLMQAWIWNMY